MLLTSPVCIHVGWWNTLLKWPPIAFLLLSAFKDPRRKTQTANLPLYLYSCGSWQSRVQLLPTPPRPRRHVNVACKPCRNSALSRASRHCHMVPMTGECDCRPCQREGQGLGRRQWTHGPYCRCQFSHLQELCQQRFSKQQSLHGSATHLLLELPPKSPKVQT